MTLLWMDSFDTTTSVTHYISSGGTFSFSSGRTGNAIYSNSASGYITTLIPANKTVVVGAAIKFSSLTQEDSMVVFADAASTNQVYTTINTSGYIVLKLGGGTILATSSRPLLSNIWYYVETLATIDNASGRVTVAIDDEVVIDYSGDTQVSANDNISLIALVFDNGRPTYYDDFYINTPNMLGSTLRIITLLPTIADVFQWTSGTGLGNVQNIDDSTSNGDTDYNYTGDTSKYDIFRIEDVTLKASEKILGIKMNTVAKTLDNGTARLDMRLRTSQGDYTVDSYAPTTSYKTRGKIIEKSVDTGDFWTNDQLNALKIGYLKSR